MTTFKRMLSIAIIEMTIAGCATHTTTSTTSTLSSSGAAQRYGTVVEVREDVHRTQGNPAAGAAAGAIIGGAATRGRVAGAAGGAAIGAGLSSGSSEIRRYQVRVQFEDGSVRTFAYEGGTPLRPGDQVVTTSNGRIALR